METWESLVDCLCESSFDEYLKNFEMVCSLWPMFVDYVCQTWVFPHKERFMKAWTNKVMHLGNTTTNSVDLNENVAIVYMLLVESAHWSLKRLLQNSLGDIYSIKASFETSTHVVGHVSKVTLYKKLLGMVSRYVLNEIATKYECVPYAGKNPSHCGYVMRSTHGLPCACELYKYIVSSIPLETIHIWLQRLSFSDHGLCETHVTITEEMETISKCFEQIDVCGKPLHY
ncbi:hypothetical protein GmHk_16G046446 [Glycine max]|nr:hypothetical protein GmHk_16G046446 [Glycine max]